MFQLSNNTETTKPKTMYKNKGPGLRRIGHRSYIMSINSQINIFYRSDKYDFRKQSIFYIGLNIQNFELVPSQNTVPT